MPTDTTPTDTLPHFICVKCKCWNGLSKGRTDCRHCGEPRLPDQHDIPLDKEKLDKEKLISALAVMSTEYGAMLETLARQSERCSMLLDVSRAAKRLIDMQGPPSDALVMNRAVLYAELTEQVEKLRDLEKKMGVT